MGGVGIIRSVLLTTDVSSLLEATWMVLLAVVCKEAGIEVVFCATYHSNS